MSTSFSPMEQRYRDQVVEHYNRLSLTGLPERDPGLHGVPLERVFVKLNTQVAQAGGVDAAFAGELARLQRELEALEQEGKSKRDGRVQQLRVEIDRLEVEARKPKTVTLSVAEALHQYRRLVVIGGPGSGKTTLTRWLALTFARNCQAEADRLGANFVQPRLPILLELRRFAQRFKTLSDEPTVPDMAAEIAEYISQHGYFVGTSAEFIRDELSRGRCLLLIDGLDEVPDLAARREVMDAIYALLRRPDRHYRQNLCLLTSRPHGYRDTQLGGYFQNAQVKPFEMDDVRLFIGHWYDTAYGSDAQEEANNLLEAMEANTRVTELATNPLLCTIIAIVYRNNRILPNRRVELYLKCCEALLDTWERNKAIRESGLIGRYDWQTKLELLAPLAYWLHEERERLSAPEEEFVTRLSQILIDKGLESATNAPSEARRFLAAIRDRSGLLQGRGDGSLEFAHRTFQEYLAARHIAAHPQDDMIDLVMPHLHDAWWREVHLLVIGYLGSGSTTAPQASALLEQILTVHSPPWWFLRSRPIRVPQWLDNLVERFEDHLILELPVISFGYFWLSPQFATLWFARAFSKWQLTRRLAWVLAREFELAATGYADCNSFGTTEVTRQFLNDRAASLLLSLVYNPGRQEEKGNLLQVTTQILRGQASSAVLDSLLEALANDDNNVQEAAARSFGQLGQASSQVVDGLLQALDANDYNVRQAAARSLGQLGQSSPQVVDRLQRALTDSDYNVYRAAFRSLGQLGQAGPLPVDRWLQVLADYDYNMQQVAARSLDELEWERYSEQLFDYLLQAFTDENYNLRQAATRSLEQLGQASPQAVDDLLQTLTDDDYNVRKGAAHSLGKLSQASPQVIDGLLQALTDNDSDVQEAAVRSLGQLGQASPQVVDGLLKALIDGLWKVPQAAARSLGQLGQANPQVIDGLLQALADCNSDAQQAAAKSLGELGLVSPQVADGLLEALADDYLMIRQAAASSLGQLEIKDEAMLYRTLVALNRCLHDPNDNVCQAALESIRQLVEGRPLPGYQWVPLRERKARRRRVKRLVDVGLIILVFMTASVYWEIIPIDPESVVMKVMQGLVFIAGVLAMLVQIVDGEITRKVSKWWFGE